MATETEGRPRGKADGHARGRSAQPRRPGTHTGACRGTSTPPAAIRLSAYQRAPLMYSPERRASPVFPIATASVRGGAGAFAAPRAPHGMPARGILHRRLLG